MKRLDEWGNAMTSDDYPEKDGCDVPVVATPESIAIARLLRNVTHAVGDLRAAVDSGALADGAERDGAWHVFNLARSLRQAIADCAAKVAP